jgi:hypothetical protein
MATIIGNWASSVSPPSDYGYFVKLTTSSTTSPTYTSNLYFDFTQSTDTLNALGVTVNTNYQGQDVQVQVQGIAVVKFSGTKPVPNDPLVLSTNGVVVVGTRSSAVGIALGYGDYANHVRCLLLTPR